ncbi:MAG TPA: tRNA (adenosine(37)-N6)-threonylcarbamoyltransferase complex ATPase subunit type 1 TsaE [Pseudomonas xinjiangensis]|uniref:tRNA threonylcarbamoyladenosine biosynthesis protein TsaE n=2 Tax=root TaxID=1 RepID=A0A7V1BQX7_9GAMM|nr:tRNA (adenosine(37)-N6)-threonylcarbamoyltransferase complex ATPase subunit type 1 TsaE [Halopseudomonas xinjiangensis]HEC49462.1 tRNA (adenosine(37)-N6)-threonylcarbamoyltransferase complex ATPase subunit type 1 TsaE [Halopseudomonas xinjiangensis]
MFEQFYAEGEKAMEAAGARIGAALEWKGIVYLDGDLGAGKTTLSRGLIRAKGHQGAVKSPTFTLVEPYEFPGGAIYHFDLYRLLDPEELEFLGIRDYFTPDSLCLIEWPEKGKGVLPSPDLTITIATQGAGRYLSIEGQSAHGVAACQKFYNNRSGATS